MRLPSFDDEMRPLAGLTLLAFVVAIIGLLGGLGGCAGSGKSSGDTLVADVHAFNNAVRWDRREEAAARMAPQLRNDFMDRAEEIEDDVRVDDWELSRVELGKDLAKVRVFFFWHREREAVVKKTYVDQRWRKLKGRWMMIRARTRKGDPMPSFEKPELAMESSETR